ncbi:hypothetical protein [Tritonibacter mobilis]|uniref:hypothetical protein n=1 Tax=Tritonibacter mobilis TaxID=379347 RepID=UPI000E0D33C9|nr:hypothetical protein [Tritonibacter mobilis]
MSSRIEREGRNHVEVAAFNFLCAKYGEKEVVREPNGYKTFPDFMVNNRLLFEATKLTQGVEQAGESGEFYHALLQSIENVVEQLVLPSWCERDLFLCFEFHFPIGRDRVLRKESRDVQRALREFWEKFLKQNSAQLNTDIEIWKGVSLRVIEGEASVYPTLSVGSFNVANLTGFVVPDTTEQLITALDRKTPKLLASKMRYEEAWLVVGGGASVGFRKEDIKHLAELSSNYQDWRGCVLLSFQEPSRSICFDFSM